MFKRIFILISFALAMSSCQKDLSFYSPTDISKYDFFEEASIEAPQQGMVAVAISKQTGDTLIISRVEATFEKGLFDEIEVSYVPNVISRAATDYLLPDTVMTVWNEKHLVMFEDSENGDSDFNDIVVWVTTDKKKNSDGYHINELILYPIALGSSDGMVIDFGVVLPDGSEKVVKNVRKEMFNSASGFINTECDNVKIENVKKIALISKEDESVVGKAVGGIRFFIEVNGKRIYAAYGGTNGNAGINVSKQGIPCGIVVSQKYSYPKERVNIFTLYPLFDKWLKGQLNDIDAKPFDKVSDSEIAVEID